MLPAPYDPAEIQPKLWEGWHGTIAWEIGANLGQSISDDLARFSRVVAFEPSVEAFAEAEKDWGSNPRVILDPRAVGAGDGFLDLAVRQAPIQTGQLTAINMPYRGEDRGPGTAQWGPELGRRRLPCVTMDSIASETWKFADGHEITGYADWAKIDTEGHELAILQGGARTLARGHTSFLVEFHTRNNYRGCMKILAAAGYVLETVRHPHYAEGSDMWHMHGWIRATAPH